MADVNGTVVINFEKGFEDFEIIGEISEIGPGASKNDTLESLTQDFVKDAQRNSALRRFVKTCTADGTKFTFTLTNKREYGAFVSTIETKINKQSWELKLVNKDKVLKAFHANKVV